MIFDAFPILYVFMTLHIGYKSPFRTNLLPTNLSGNGLFLFYMVFKKRSGLQRFVFSQSFHIFRPFFKVPLKFPHYTKKCKKQFRK